jgi:hypothetical protein
MHKTVTGEAIDTVEPFHIGCLTQNGMGIGAHFVKACPAAADGYLLQKGHPFHGCFEVGQLLFAVDGLVKARGLFEV